MIVFRLAEYVLQHSVQPLGLLGDAVVPMTRLYSSHPRHSSLIVIVILSAGVVILVVWDVPPGHLVLVLPCFSMLELILVIQAVVATEGIPFEELFKAIKLRLRSPLLFM